MISNNHDLFQQNKNFSNTLDFWKLMHLLSLNMGGTDKLCLSVPPKTKPKHNFQKAKVLETNAYQNCGPITEEAYYGR